MRFARLFGPVSVLTLLVAAPAMGTPFNITTTNQPGQTLGAAESGTVSSTGGISAVNAHGVEGSSTPLSITNAGTIFATGISRAAVYVTGGISSITNSGSMSTQNWTAVRITGGVTGTFLNDTGGSITSSNDTTIVISGAVATLTNRGTISNSSSDDALYVGGLVGTFENSGLVESLASTAVWFNSGVSDGTNTSTGVIRTNGTTDAALRLAGAGSNFVNAGTITAPTGGKAILMTENSDALTLMTGSTTTGSVDGGNGSDTLKFDGAGSSSFAANQLTSFEIISKVGSGTWTLSGDNGATIAATIAAGRLSINGDMSATSLAVTGGTLGGSGTVGAVNVSSGAAIAPGNSVGTLTTGNVTFAAGAVYEVEVAGSAADLLNVVGSVTLNGAVTVNVNATAACGTLSAPIITTTGGFSGPGSFVLGSGPAGSSLTQSGNNLLLSITGGTGRLFTGFTNTLNQASTAAALDAMGCGNQPYAAQLAALTDAQVPAAMDALSGEGHASIAAAMIEASQLLNSAVSARLDQAFAKVDSSGAASGYAGLPSLLDPGVIDGLSIWGGSYGGALGRAGDGNAGPMQNFSGGLVFGADGQVSEDWRLGLMGSLGVNATQAQATTGTSTDASIGGYAGGKIGIIRIKAGALYTRHFITTSRSIIFPGVNDTVTAAYQAGTAQAFLEIGADIEAGDVTITPFAKVAGVNHAVDAFTETGGAGRLTTAASVSNALFVTLGVGAEHSFVLNDTMLVTARGSVGWRHAFADQARVVNSFVGGGPFTIAAASIASDVAVVSAGVSVDINKDVSLDIGYEGALGNGYGSHAVKLTLSGRF